MNSASPRSRLYTRVHVHAGVIRRDITPPVDIFFKSWGAAKGDQAEAIHRPFTATVLALKDRPDSEPAVLIALDAGWWQSGGDERYVREGVLEALGIDAANLMLNLSHTHAGPSLSSDNAGRRGGEHIGPYLDKLRSELAAAAVEAVGAAAPCELVWTTGRCDLAAQRSLPDPQSDRFLTGYNPMGPADDTLLVGRLSARGGANDGKSLLTIANYACHPTTLAWENTQLSPDYIGAMREVVETATSAPCMFLQGASGELAPAWQYVGDVAVADKHGRKLGHAVLATLEGLLEPGHDLVYQGVVESGAPLGVWRPEAQASASTGVALRRTSVKLPIKDDYPPLAEIERQLASATEHHVKERLLRKSRLRKTIGEGADVAFPVWVWRVGHAYVVGYPGEAFSVLQRRLREAYPERRIVVTNVTNGSIGYLPPAELYREDMYEVWQTPMASGSLERVIDACLEAIAGLEREADGPDAAAGGI